MYKFNKFLYLLSLRGLGILNSQNLKVSGEKKFLSSFLKIQEHPIIFDVGANIGNYSNEILKLNGNAKIYAFEPHPITFQKLNNNLGNYLNVYNIGFDNYSGPAKIYDYSSKNCSSHASVYKNVIEEIQQGISKEYDINITKIDDFVYNNNIKSIDLLKIDTEGNEYRVLEGAKWSIDSGKIKAIHFEFNEMNVISRTFFKDFFDFLEGFRLYRLLPDGMVPIDAYKPKECEIFAYQNIIAIKK